jgi:hypothetical protein
MTYLRNPEEARKRQQEYRARNKERLRYDRLRHKKQSSYAFLSPEEKRKRLDSIKRSDAKNPQRQIRRNIERPLLIGYLRLRKGLRLLGAGKGAVKTEALLGCSWIEFKAHIEKQLEPYGWTWADHKDKWTMDHVIPVRKFDLPGEKFACWNYTNLRPLPKGKNSMSQIGFDEVKRQEAVPFRRVPLKMQVHEPFPPKVKPPQKRRAKMKKGRVPIPI